MEDDGGATKTACVCPECGQRYRVETRHVGKGAQCKKCGALFKLAPAEAQAEPPVPEPAPGEPVCAICQYPIRPDEPATSCPDCKAPYHQACWEYNKGCGVYGCSRVPPTEPADTLAIPASYWGKDEKNCPRCNRQILAAAVRCRHCGATFSSARPETATEFRRRTSVEQKLPGVRKTGIWLLLFSILSCTAPFAAIFGGIWYANNRREIQALPGLYSALCKIAVGLAIAQSTLAIVVAILYGVFRG